MWNPSALGPGLNQGSYNLMDSHEFRPQKRRLEPVPERDRIGGAMHETQGAQKRRSCSSSSHWVANLPSNHSPLPIFSSVSELSSVVHQSHPRSHTENLMHSPGVSTGCWNTTKTNQNSNRSATYSPAGVVEDVLMIPPSPVRYPETPAGSAASFFSPPSSGPAATQDIDYSQTNLGLKQLHLERLQRRVAACAAQHQGSKPPALKGSSFGSNAGRITGRSGFR